MNLSPMRFKTFVWPHNPETYSITYQRKMAVNKIPFGRYHLQSLGQTRRVFKGEGEFVGAEAYKTFSQLASLFYEETPGQLVHPVWVTTNAWFVGLELLEEPKPDYVRYCFEFWEVIGGESAKLTARTADGAHTVTDPTAWTAPEEELIHTVVRGDTLWALAGRYGVTVEDILALNPAIYNPNLILVGQKVRVR